MIVYLLASVAISIAYGVSDDAWDIALHRNGLLVAGGDGNAVYILSPFCNYGDVFLIGVTWRDGNFRVFSDGLYCFGEWKISGKW